MARKKTTDDQSAARSEGFAALLRSVDSAVSAATDIAFESFDLPDAERSEAEQAFEVLAALADSLASGSRRGLGALRSGARNARKHLPAAKTVDDPERDLEREIVRLVSRVEKPKRSRRSTEPEATPGGVPIDRLAVLLAVRLRARSAILPRAATAGDEFFVDDDGKRKPVSTIDRFIATQNEQELAKHAAIVAHVLRRFATGDWIFVPKTDHREGASPRKRETLCRCPRCVSGRIIAASKRALSKK